MRLITRADDELYGLASIAAKLGRSGRLLDRLGSDPFALALAQMATLPSIEVEFEAHSRFTEIIDAFGGVLEVEPEHWLARYSRARLRALIPSSYGAFTVQVSGELLSAAEDLRVLIGQQAGVEYQPYFASAHALAAVVDHLSGAQAFHLAALRECEPAPVRLPALGAILCEPLVTLCAISPSLEIRELTRTLYGDQRVVVLDQGSDSSAIAPLNLPRSRAESVL